MSTTNVNKAVKALGGQSETGRLMLVSPQAVQYWIRSGRVPSKRMKRFLALLAERQKSYPPQALNPYFGL